MRVGISGMGRIGRAVADRARVFGMRVAYHSRRAVDAAGAEALSLDRLLVSSDVVSLHCPLTPETRHLIDAKAMAKMKKGVRIVNCARGGLVDELAVRDLLVSGHIAGAGFDVFTEEPAKQNVLFGAPNLVCTPHLGASTLEAQENVALQVAEQMSDYLLTGAIVNSLNMPNVSAEDAPRLAPYLDLAEKLGSFAGQLTDTEIKAVAIEYEGQVAALNIKPLSQVALMGVLRPQLTSVNMVNAPVIARERGIEMAEVKHERSSDYSSMIRLTVTSEKFTRSVTGTLFGGARPRIVNIKGIRMDAEFGPSMVYITNLDKPGFIGKFSGTMGDAGINIATFHVGREAPGGNAIALIEIDGEMPADVLAKVRALPQVQSAKPLKF